LWVAKYFLYLSYMQRKLYNLRLLADKPLRDQKFDIFIDGFAASIDIDPICIHPQRNKPINALWEDFVRIASDANTGLTKNHKLIE